MDSAAIDKALAPLVEFPLPAAPPLWPQTPADHVLLVAVAACVLVGAWRWLRRRRANRYRREAMAEWHAIDRRLGLAGAGPELVSLETLLRRVALVAFPRARVAALSGREWRDFLNHSGDGQSFAGPAGIRLTEAAYRPAVPVAPDEIRAASVLVRRWIENHHA